MTEALKSASAVGVKQKQQSPIQELLRQVDVLTRARYPIIYLVTHEETRLEKLLCEVAAKQSKPLLGWTVTGGLTRLYDPNTSKQSIKAASTECSDPQEILKYIKTKNMSGLFLLKDFHPYLNDPLIVRLLRDVANELKVSYRNIIITAPQLTLPLEIEKEVTILDVPLPDMNELLALLGSLCKTIATKDKGAVRLTNQDAWAIAKAAQGLTLSEAENVFSKAVVQDSMLDSMDVKLVLSEKQQVIRKSAILEFIEPDSSMDEVGGLENLKDWLKMRSAAFSNKAFEFGLPAPRGLLLLGAPGCGKSLTAKTVSLAWKLPLLRLDFGKIFSGLVGSSEENMRRALKVAEGVSPAVLWIDEIEKGLSGSLQGNSDSGTAARVFATFLTWMQEKAATVFVIATANKINMLPPELLRRGRFDEIFFIDLPGDAARLEIASIHLKKKNRDPSKMDLSPFIDATQGYSGAEIEHCITQGLFLAFSESRDLTGDDLKRVAKEMVPLSVTYAEELEQSRNWARTRARSADDINSDTKAVDRVSRLEVAR